MEFSGCGDSFKVVEERKFGICVVKYEYGQNFKELLVRFWYGKITNQLWKVFRNKRSSILFCFIFVLLLPQYLRQGATGTTKQTNLEITLFISFQMNIHFEKSSWPVQLGILMNQKMGKARVDVSSFIVLNFHLTCSHSLPTNLQIPHLGNVSGPHYIPPDIMFPRK